MSVPVESACFVGVASGGEGGDVDVDGEGQGWGGEGDIVGGGEGGGRGGEGGGGGGDGGDEGDGQSDTSMIARESTGSPLPKGA